MSGPTFPCPSCGRINNTHRIWCCQCAAPLPHDEKPLPKGESYEDTSRKKLYEQILADLSGLQNSRQASPSIFQTIRNFYQLQIAEIESARLDRERDQVVHRCLASARHASQKGQYQQAINLLQNAGSTHQSNSRLKDAVAEITAKIAECENAQRLAREAEEIASVSASMATASGSTKKPSLEMGKFGAWEEPLSTDEEIIVATIVDPPLAKLASPQPSKAAVAVASKPELDTIVTKTNPEVGTQRAMPTSFAEEFETVTPTQRFIEATSKWSAVLKPFLLDNVGWFVGAFLVVAGFGILIVTFWSSIEQNQILMHSLVFASLAVATGAFFSTAYYMRLHYPKLESSSNVLLVIVALLIPMVFAAAMLTSMIPGTQADTGPPIVSETAAQSVDAPA